MRRYGSYFLLIALLLADASCFLLEKIACNRAEGEGWKFLASVLHQPYFWIAITLGPIQLWLWTRILGKMDLSLAYPLTGLNMPLTLVAATVLLGERLPWPVWTGAGLIMLGGAIMGPGMGEENPPSMPPV